LIPFDIVKKTDMVFQGSPDENNALLAIQGAWHMFTGWGLEQAHWLAVNIAARRW
jgi:hypothetical protein